jgi:hypothetical protein
VARAKHDGKSNWLETAQELAALVRDLRAAEELVREQRSFIRRWLYLRGCGTFVPWKTHRRKKRNHNVVRPADKQPNPVPNLHLDQRNGLAEGLAAVGNGSAGSAKHSSNCDGDKPKVVRNNGKRR